ncbi:hypothetical protein HDU67_003180 [Dinochytrium kinnereticum]|nr:hypothetical protein HDU67_003180 [Dinochytrium kinnereticum]
MTSHLLLLLQKDHPAPQLNNNNNNNNISSEEQQQLQQPQQHPQHQEEEEEEDDDEDTRSLKPREPPLLPSSSEAIIALLFPPDMQHHSTTAALPAPKSLSPLTSTTSTTTNTTTTNNNNKNTALVAKMAAAGIASPAFSLADISESDLDNNDSDDTDGGFSGKAGRHHHHPHVPHLQESVQRATLDFDDDDDDSSWSAHLSRSSSNSRLADSTWASAYSTIASGGGVSHHPASSNVGPTTPSPVMSSTSASLPTTTKASSPTCDLLPPLQFSPPISASLPSFHVVPVRAGALPVRSSAQATPHHHHQTAGLAPVPNGSSAISPPVVSATTAHAQPALAAHHHNGFVNLVVGGGEGTGTTAANMAMENPTAYVLSATTSIPSSRPTSPRPSTNHDLRKKLHRHSSVSTSDMEAASSWYHPSSRPLTTSEIKKMHRTSALSQTSHMSAGLDPEDRFLMNLLERIEEIEARHRAEGERGGAGGVASSTLKRSSMSSFFGVGLGRSVSAFSTNPSSASSKNGGSGSSSTLMLTPPDSPPPSSPSPPPQSTSTFSRISPLPAKLTPFRSASSSSSSSSSNNNNNSLTPAAQTPHHHQQTPSSSSPFTFITDIFSRAFGSHPPPPQTAPAFSRSHHLAGPTLSRTPAQLRRSKHASSVVLGPVRRDGGGGGGGGGGASGGGGLGSAGERVREGCWFFEVGDLEKAAGCFERGVLEGEGGREGDALARFAW